MALEAKKVLDRYRDAIRPNVGEHKKTKLRRVREARGLATILHDPVSAAHAAALLKQFEERWGALAKPEEAARLRFCTVLDSVELVDVEKTLATVDSMEERLRAVFGAVGGIEVIGVVEVEVISISKMRARAGEGGEARKLDVIESLLVERFGQDHGFDKSCCLVHFHGLVDLGVTGAAKEAAIKHAAEQQWHGAYRFELKSTFKDRDIQANLKGIASYLVKGGNESLIYKIGFGRDAADEVERQMLKEGYLSDDPEFEGLENQLSLSMHEIGVLASIIERLMDRRASERRNGYLFKHGQRLGRMREHRALQIRKSRSEG